MVESIVKSEVKAACMQKLSAAGATPELCKFYADAIQYEYDMTHVLYRLQCEMREEISKTSSLPPALLYDIIKNMTKHFHTWRQKIDTLQQDGNKVPPFQVQMGRPLTFKAVCSLETNELNLQEGEEAVVTDSSHPNWLKVRNSRGDEGYVPAMPCILPTPDNTALTAVERLEILLLTSWTECIRKIKLLVKSTLTSSSTDMRSQWNKYLYQHVYLDEDRVGVRLKRIIDAVTKNPDVIDLSKVHRTLGHIETELLSMKSSNGLSTLTTTVANLDRAVLCYQTFYTQWRQFRRTLHDAPRPIKMIDQWDQLRRASQCKHFKYYEMKMTLEELETLEEITYVNAMTGELMSTIGRYRREQCESDEVTTVSQEERKRYVIRSVIDPRTNREISFRQAVKDGVVDYKTGMHRNPINGLGVPIPEAMRIGLIDVAYSSVRMSPPKIDVVALITITRRVDRNYTLTGAIDALTAERVDLTEAYRRKLIDDTTASYHNELNGQLIPLDEALDDGWVFAEYDDTNPEFDKVTYAILAVIDTRAQRIVSFLQAIKRGLIDRETGSFVDSKTGQKIYVPLAIEQGLVKARRLPKDINILSIPFDSDLTQEEGKEGQVKSESGETGSTAGEAGKIVGGDVPLGAGGLEFGFGLIDCSIASARGNNVSQK